MGETSYKEDYLSIYNELQEARGVIQGQQELINKMQNSASWKVTKPCRIIRSLIIRLSRGAKFLITAAAKSAKWIGQYGIKEGTKRIVRSVKSTIRSNDAEKKATAMASVDDEWLEFRKWLDDTEYKFIDIFSVPMGWNTKLFQRFQHISLNAGKIGGIAIYGAHPSVDTDVVLYKFITPTLCVVNLDNALVKKKMFEILDGYNELKYIRIQSIDLATTIQEIKEYIYKGYYIVYEYIDELTPQITGNIPEFVFERHAFLLKNKRVTVVATSDKLFEQAKAIRKSSINMAVSTNGVDYEYWHADRKQFDLPEELKELVNTGKKIIGYHGALAKWIDYIALKNIAEDGRYCLLLIGFEHDESLKNSKLLDNPNVYYIGSKPYNELVKYAVWYDVAILPFVLNNITLSVSPVKIFEYMALGKPVVTSALPECKKYSSCLIAQDEEDYVKQIDKAISLMNSKQYLDNLNKEALENTWTSITQHTVDLVYWVKDHEDELFNLKKENPVPDVQNNLLSLVYKNRYLNQVLNISKTEKSVYYQALTEEPYQRKEGDAKVIAYYLTQFHPDPHNEEWWGKGNTEWNNVVKAIPQFLGHYQPRMPEELGYYDLRIKSVMERQVELAKMYGVYGFSFYYYWFAMDENEEKEMRSVPSDYEYIEEVYGTNTDILMEQPSSYTSYKNVIHDMVRFLKDPRYICIDGKKVITVYRPSLMPKVREVLEYWRQYVREQGLGELYIIAVKEHAIEVDWLYEGYDALSEFHPGTVYKECTEINDEMEFIRSDFAGEVFSYKDIVLNKRYFDYSYKKLYRAVMPMWDNTARRNNKGMIFHDATPTLYKEWLMDVINENCEKKDKEDNIVFINAWNEWGEGAYLEPDKFYGYAFLNATKEAVEESNSACRS